MSVLTIEFDKLPEDERNRVLKALDRLCTGNPEIARQLEKLADLKENNPKQWNLGKKILKL